ncbi:MAG: PIN domain-containing protein [Candidatus Dormibacteria bacterium]
MSGAVLDAGALIGFERGDRRVVAIVQRALVNGDVLVVPACALAQAWRDGRRQVRLARLLGSRACEIAPLDGPLARAAGQLCGVSSTADVVDASIAVVARQRQLPVVTSDPGDLRRLDGKLELHPI